jgi:hypothetical protein
VHAKKAYMESKLLLNSFLTSVLNAGAWSASQPFYPEKRGPHVPKKLLAGLASHPFWMTSKREKYLPLSGMKPQFLGIISVV